MSRVYLTPKILRISDRSRFRGEYPVRLAVLD